MTSRLEKWNTARLDASNAIAWSESGLLPTSPPCFYLFPLPSSCSVGERSSWMGGWLRRSCWATTSSSPWPRWVLCFLKQAFLGDVMPVCSFHSKNVFPFCFRWPPYPQPSPPPPHVNRLHYPEGQTARNSQVEIFKDSLKKTIIPGLSGEALSTPRKLVLLILFSFEADTLEVRAE